MIEQSEAKDFLVCRKHWRTSCYKTYAYNLILFQWKDPADYLWLQKEGEIGFWPPQFYELSRLYSEKSFDNLLKFSQGRSRKGIVLFMHVIYVCTDGTVSVLPGKKHQFLSMIIFRII